MIRFKTYGSGRVDLVPRMNPIQEAYLEPQLRHQGQQQKQEQLQEQECYRVRPGGRGAALVDPFLEMMRSAFLDWKTRAEQRIRALQPKISITAILLRKLIVFIMHFPKDPRTMFGTSYWLDRLNEVCLGGEREARQRMNSLRDDLIEELDAELEALLESSTWRWVLPRSSLEMLGLLNLIIGGFFRLVTVYFMRWHRAKFAQFLRSLPRGVLERLARQHGLPVPRRWDEESSRGLAERLADKLLKSVDLRSCVRERARTTIESSSFQTRVESRARLLRDRLIQEARAELGLPSESPLPPARLQQIEDDVVRQTVEEFDPEVEQIVKDGLDDCIAERMPIPAPLEQPDPEQLVPVVVTALVAALTLAVAAALRLPPSLVKPIARTAVAALIPLIRELLAEGKSKDEIVAEIQASSDYTSIKEQVSCEALLEQARELQRQWGQKGLCTQLWDEVLIAGLEDSSAQVSCPEAATVIEELRRAYERECGSREDCQSVAESARAALQEWEAAGRPCDRAWAGIVSGLEDQLEDAESRIETQAPERPCPEAAQAVDALRTAYDDQCAEER